ncbi:hypothetical protein GGS23DRAFT_331625 [Durotheca rogersii]|uniref:uncharacterized protein n=1 Tax=Durotheca rogersii TaxID=419775 RepID=UPI00221FB494|nr:uncharacterized protein GGS23DRAFT_331625 [Durotheca rogersii]KAI5858263.1 hypothetical protein GGS23DRAFT_331625 [Durotheca rogersii]
MHMQSASSDGPARPTVRARTVRLGNNQSQDASRHEATEDDLSHHPSPTDAQGKTRHLAVRSAPRVAPHGQLSSPQRRGCADLSTSSDSYDTFLTPPGLSGYLRFQPSNKEKKETSRFGITPSTPLWAHVCVECDWRWEEGQCLRRCSVAINRAVTAAYRCYHGTVPASARVRKTGRNPPGYCVMGPRISPPVCPVPDDRSRRGAGIGSSASSPTLLRRGYAHAIPGSRNGAIRRSTSPGRHASAAGPPATRASLTHIHRLQLGRRPAASGAKTPNPGRRRDHANEGRRLGYRAYRPRIVSKLASDICHLRISTSKRNSREKHNA